MIPLVRIEPESSDSKSNIESEGPGSISSRGITGFFLFSHSKDENTNIGISVCMWKTLMSE